MSELTDCLLSNTPRVINIPPGTACPEEPIPWAINLMRARPEHSTLQIMKWAQGNTTADEGEVSHLDAENPDHMNRFVEGVQSGLAIHGRQQVLHFGSGNPNFPEPAQWVWDFCSENFNQRLTLRNPLGFYIKGTLWVSTGQHKYSAHCDMADGFLIHLSGKKCVRVWPLPEQYLNKTIFNFGDPEGRSKLEPMEFELEPGQILFIPGGAMHEVIAQKTDTAVSVSFHMGSPYSLVRLCKELNMLLGREEIFLKPNYSSEFKFKIYFFQPSDFTEPENMKTDDLPETLADSLSFVLEPNQIDRAAMIALLTRWWKQGIQQPNYYSPFPSGHTDSA